MAAFTTRVELHKATPEDYDTLHKAMTKEGFTNTILVDRKLYYMPTAEYNKEGRYTLQSVSNSAIRAAQKTGKDFSIVVTESNGRIITNLTPVKRRI